MTEINNKNYNSNNNNNIASNEHFWEFANDQWMFILMSRNAKRL